VSCETNPNKASKHGRRVGIPPSVGKAAFYAGMGSLATIASLGGYRSYRGWKDLGAVRDAVGDIEAKLLAARDLTGQAMAATNRDTRLGLMEKAESLAEKGRKTMGSLKGWSFGSGMVDGDRDASLAWERFRSWLKFARMHAGVDDVCSREEATTRAIEGMEEELKKLRSASGMAVRGARKAVKRNLVIAAATGLPVVSAGTMAVIARCFTRNREVSPSGPAPAIRPDELTRDQAYSLLWQSLRGTALPASAYLLRYAVGGESRPQPAPDLGEGYVSVSGSLGRVVCKRVDRRLEIGEITPNAGYERQLAERLGAIGEVWDREGYSGVWELEDSIRRGVEERGVRLRSVTVDVTPDEISWDGDSW
jgi:hypothetical protein